MQKVKVKRDELLSKVRSNRAAHVAEYKEACAGYREAALKRIEEVAKEMRETVGRLKEGQMVALYTVQIGLTVPTSHESDYDQAIAMLEMCVDPEIEIEHEDFKKYVQDNWEWKEKFTHSNSLYKKMMG